MTHLEVVLSNLYAIYLPDIIMIAMQITVKVNYCLTNSSQIYYAGKT